jgi:Putative transposase/Transposase zinc-binding domain
LQRQYPQPDSVVRALDDISVCRTAALGGQVLRCGQCGLIDYRYHSCGNRHCPVCGGSKRAAWLQKRRSELLDVPYFHVVFTLPHRLSALVLGNRELLYGLLFEAAAQALLEVAADPRHLGARIGVLAVLHTWGQQLEHHPHVHCVVPGGGLACDKGGAVEQPWRWLSCRPTFFLPVKVLGRVFRGKYTAGLRRAYRRGELKLGGSTTELADPAAFEEFLHGLYANDWVVYAKEPFGGPQQVLAYLTGYTHRVALSNRRLVRVGDEGVTVSYKDYAANCQHKEMTLPGVEFLRRFCLHILPPGLVRIRQYGLLSNRDRTERLARCRELLGMSQQPGRVTPALPGRLALGWWLLGWLLLSSGSTELLAAALQALAAAVADGPEDSCWWCGGCCWETLWRQDRPRHTSGPASDEEDDSS